MVSKLFIKIKPGFTLIELLIVIGILAVLVTTILITLNPSEAQKKARDVKRMKDLRALETILGQYIADGNYPPAGSCLLTHPYCDTASIVGVTSQPCSNNWLGIDVCNYTKTVPLDPRNGVTGCVIRGSAASVFCNQTMRYIAIVRGSDFHVMVMQESPSNVNNVYNDGGCNHNFGTNSGQLYADAGSDPKLYWTATGTTCP